MQFDSKPGSPPPIWKVYVVEEIIKITTSHSVNPGKLTLKPFVRDGLSGGEDFR